MVRSCSIVVLVVVTVGCKKEAPKEPRFDGPMPVSFGDCAGPTVAWVSGPRPQPFTPEEAEGMRVAAAEPPRKPDPDDGGQVASIARADGHMATGQPERDGAPADPRLARQEAIDQARNAGILETIASEQGGGFASLTGTGDLGSTLDDNNIYGALLGSALEDANVHGSRLGGDAGEPNGGFGFGRSGFGPGGGTGWGMIGTIGTIGHGSGTGVGRSGGYGRAGTVPTVSIGQPSTQGDLDKAIIRRYIKRNLQKITYCYEKQLLAHPTLAGTVAAQFFIAPTGRVDSASASGVDPDVATCVVGVIKAIEFPKPRGGGGVQVHYPLIFRPAGHDVARSSAPPIQLARSPDRDAPDRPAMAEAGADSHAAGAPHVRALFRSPDRGQVDVRTYEPGANNPLRAERHALTECFRKGGQRFGAVVLELRYDATGKVNDATAHGLDDEHARSCVLATAKRLQRTGAGPAAQRCALAFGVMPPAAMPAVDITADAIKLDGKQLASLPAAETDPHGVKIPELVAAVEAEVKAATAAGPALVLHEPRIIRPLPATPMNLVVRVLTSVLAGGDDLVLAAQRGTDWQLLQSLLALPVVPVPFGTGGTWNHVKGKRGLFASNTSGDGERVTLSLLVTPDRIWVGLSRVHEFQEIARGSSQLDKLAEALRAHKASALFADRSDVEIAADGSVTYGDVVGVIDTALKTGFTGWQLTTPTGLTAPPSL